MAIQDNGIYFYFMKYYINYADKNFQSKQGFALTMAKLLGGFDKVTGYSKKDIDDDFYNKHKNILNQSRGGGFWLWKPYLILKKLEEINNGDYLFYSDSGAFFLKNISHLIIELNKSSQCIMAFELPLIESQWTKKELIINMKCDSELYTNSNMIMAGFQLIKKSNRSVAFYKDFLDYACNIVNIDDSRNPLVKQSDDFIDHRHDQSIFSLLYKKYKLKPFKDATQFGEYPIGYSGKVFMEYEFGKMYVLSNNRKFRTFNYEERYSKVIFLNRINHPVISYIKFMIKHMLYKSKVYKKKF
jgi:hypothetical protein